MLVIKAPFLAIFLPDSLASTEQKTSDTASLGNAFLWKRFYCDFFHAWLDHKVIIRTSLFSQIIALMLLNWFTQSYFFLNELDRCLSDCRCVRLIKGPCHFPLKNLDSPVFSGTLSYTFIWGAALLGCNLIFLNLVCRSLTASRGGLQFTRNSHLSKGKSSLGSWIYLRSLGTQMKTK